MANNHLRRLVKYFTSSIAIAIIIAAVLTSALPLVSMEGPDALASMNETWDGYGNFGTTAPVDAKASVPVTATHSRYSPDKTLPAHTGSKATALTTEKADGQFINLSGSSEPGPGAPRLVTVYSSIEGDNQQQQNTDPSSELPKITGGPYPPPGMAPKITEVDAVYPASQTAITVPGYQWRYGCGPTAVGMVIGYYDMQGVDNLFPGDASTQTDAVNQGIASERNAANPGHYEDYSLPLDDRGPDPNNPLPPLPDRSEPPAGDEHAHDCIADFMETSWSSKNCYYGETDNNLYVSAFESYVDLRTPWVPASASKHTMGLFGSLDWDLLTNEIDNNRPMVFSVDTDADGSSNHAVTVVGYRTEPRRQYGCLDTGLFVNTPRWEDFQEVAVGQNWGISRGWSFKVGGIIDIRDDGLKIGNWGTISVDVLTTEADDYKVGVWDDDGWSGPEWEWQSVMSLEYTLDSVQAHTFTFQVKPDDTSEGFEFWLYQRLAGGFWKAIHKVQTTLLAEGQDITPPNVLSHDAGTVPGTNIYVTFSEDMNDSTLTNSNIIVSGSSSGTHSCSFSFDHSSYELTINPSSDFSYGEEVTVTIGTGVQDLTGNSLVSAYEFSFTIQNEPPDTPSSIYISSMSLSPSTVDPHEQFEVSGYAEYDTSSPVAVGTANIVISSGGGSWTTPVTDGTFSRYVQAPGNDGTSPITRTVTVTVSDGSVTPDSESRTLTIRGVEPENYYEFTNALTCEHVQSSSPYDPITIKPAFSKDDDQFLVWVHLEMLYKSVQVRWEWYDPDGSLYATHYSDWTDDPQDENYEYWYWWKFAKGWKLRNPAGGYWAHAGMEGDWRCDVSVQPEGGSFEHVATVDFTIRYDLVEHKMCEDVQSADPWDPVDGTETNTFSPDDTKAMTWAKYIYVSDPLDMKWVFNSPEGLYDEFTYTSDDPGEDSWVPWAKGWGWIDIAGWPAADKCGDWYVDVLVKDAWDNYEWVYTDYFRIEEHTPPSTSVLATPSIPIETQNVVIDVSASDNNHLKKIVLHWNDGSDHTQTWDNINAGSYSPSHSIGSFSGGQMVSYWAEAWDESGNRAESEHHSFAVQEEVVTIPEQPAGESYRKCGQSGSYQTGGSTTDLGDSVEYQFDWGDTTQSAWGSSTQSHSWPEGYYFIKARARCQTHFTRISDWSQSFTVLVDCTAPMVEITTNDGNDFSTAETQIVLEGIAFDPEPASEPDSVTISTGDPNEGTLSNWLFTVDLNDGPNTLTVTATDRAGNSASDTIVITRANTLTLNLKAGWNMVSVPAILADNLTSAVFPGVAGVFTWNATSRSYYVPTVIEPEKGYWVAVTENTTISINGTPVDTWTTDIKAGWNMIGSVSATASIADPNDDPDDSVIASAYWWDPVGRSYTVTPEIEPGKGYWVASVNDCTLTL